MMSKMDVLEKHIEKSILQYLNQVMGAFAWKNATMGVWDPRKKIYRTNTNLKGVSDIICIFNRQVFFIEVKTKTGKLSEHQKHFIDECNERGVKAFVARSIQDVVDNLKET